MKPSEILESLSLLDPSDDEHWTQEGAPRLDVVGKGVTRAEIQAVAPLFNRKNAELPEPPAPEPTLEDRLMAIQAKTDEANQVLKQAITAKAQAELDLLKAQTALEDIRREQLALDTRTDTEINMDYLKSEFNQRLARANRRKHITDMLEAADLSSSDVRILTLSPADRAIAERVIRERRDRMRKGAKA